CARIKVNLSSKPDFIEDRERTLQMLEREKRGLLRDIENRVPADAARLDDIDALTASTQAELDELRQRFQAQYDAAQRILALRAERAQVRDGTASPASADTQAPATDETPAEDGAPAATARGLAAIESELTEAEQVLDTLQAQ